MRTSRGLAIALLLLIGTIQRPAFSQSQCERSANNFVCRPLPLPQSADLTRANESRRQNPRICPSGQYPERAEHEVAEVKCRPLPLSTDAQIADAFAQWLEDRRICPAGQFPMRFGSGNDLKPGETCVTSNDTGGAGWNWRLGRVSGESLEIAHTMAVDLARVVPCPRGQEWRPNPADLKDSEPEIHVPPPPRSSPRP